jgi:hypothetical protein
VPTTGDAAVGPDRRTDFWPTLFAGAVWLACVGAALSFVGSYGANLPWADDFEIVPQLTGRRPVTAGWLWSQHNEHRIAVPRLVLLALFRLTGGDFRGGMYFTVAVPAGVSLAMVLAARRLQGGTRYWDAFFPLAALHGGQAENLLWCWQVQFSASVLFVSLALLAVVREPSPRSPAVLLTAGLCAVALPLCGANGLAFAPPLALWLLACALPPGLTCPPPGRAARAAAVFLALASLALTGAYFLGYTPPDHGSPAVPPGPLEVSAALARFLSTGLGAGSAGWPVRAGCAAALLFGGLAVLAGVWRRSPEERPRAAGLAAVLAGYAALALGVAWGRAALGPEATLAGRYSTLAVPAFCAVYFVWVLYPRPGRFPFARAGQFALALAVFALSAVDGVRYARAILPFSRSVTDDLRAGLPRELLARRHPGLYPPDVNALAEFLGMLRDAGVGDFRSLPPDRRLRRVSWTSGEVTRDVPHGLVRLGRPRRVYAVEVRARYIGPKAAADLTVTWSPGAAGTAEPARGAVCRIGHEPRVYTFWVNEEVGEVRFSLDGPGQLSVLGLDLVTDGP